MRIRLPVISIAISPRVSPTELKIRELLTTSAGLSIAPTVVRLSEWLASIQAGTLEKPSARRLANGDPTKRIAESLIANASATERRLLLKSLQEALYYAVRFDADIAEAQLITRLSRYLRRWGASAFIRRFFLSFAARGRAFAGDCRCWSKRQTYHRRGITLYGVGSGAPRISMTPGTLVTV